MENSCRVRSRAVLKIIISLLAACLIASSAKAANNCPWLNEATASGLLGAQAVGSFQAPVGQPAICIFTQQSSGTTRILQIEVDTRPDAAAHLKALEKTCPSDSAPMQAIGNEAISCLLDDRGGRPGGEVLGRVRDQVFVIRVTTSQKNDPFLTRSALQRLINSAAEQVAGNLF
jgi:hypothetical protein